MSARACGWCHVTLDRDGEWCDVLCDEGGYSFLEVTAVTSKGDSGALDLYYGTAMDSADCGPTGILLSLCIMSRAYWNKPSSSAVSWWFYEYFVTASSCLWRRN